MAVWLNELQIDQTIQTGGFMYRFSGDDLVVQADLAPR